jgi:hypothetical protein
VEKSRSNNRLPRVTFGEVIVHVSLALLPSIASEGSWGWFGHSVAVSVTVAPTTVTAMGPPSLLFRHVEEMPATQDDRCASLELA